MLVVGFLQMVFIKLRKFCPKRLRLSEIMHKKKKVCHSQMGKQLLISLSHLSCISKDPSNKCTVLLSNSLYTKQSTHDSFNNIKFIIFSIRHFLPEELGHKNKTITFCFKLVAYIIQTIRLLNIVMAQTMPHIAYIPTGP